MASLFQKVAGVAGKAITSVGTALNAPRLGGLFGQPGAALGASLQSFGGQKIPSPFAFINPPTAKAAEPQVFGASTQAP